MQFHNQEVHWSRISSIHSILRNVLQAKQSRFIKVQVVFRGIFCIDLPNPFLLLLDSLNIYRSSFPMPMKLLQIVARSILLVSCIFKSNLYTYVQQKFDIHPPLVSLSFSGTPKATSNFSCFMTNIGPLTCSPFSSMCLTHLKSASSTSGHVTTRIHLDDKAVGFDSSRCLSSSRPLLDRWQDKLPWAKMRASSFLFAKCLTTSSWEIGWCES